MKTETISKVSTALDEYLSDEEKKLLPKKQKQEAKNVLFQAIHWLKWLTDSSFWKTEEFCLTTKKTIQNNRCLLLALLSIIIAIFFQ